jgi:hypothetical protein
MSGADSHSLDSAGIELHTKPNPCGSPPWLLVLQASASRPIPWKMSSPTSFLDSVLAALLNLSGSVEAIDKHTRALEYYAIRDPSGAGILSALRRRRICPHSPGELLSLIGLPGFATP